MKISRTDTSAPLPEDARRIGKEIAPGRTLRTLYTIYLLIIVWGGILPWLIPLAFSSSPLLTLAVSLPLLLLVAFALWWIRAYCRTIRYRCTPAGISWERGVWFRKAGTVPYHQITTIDIVQGPISRALGISHLKVQAAGHASAKGPSTGLKIEGITEPETLRAFIMMQMQGVSNASAATKNGSFE
jgi:membrane protein YdbS with pleckstrin-like domain